VAPQSLNPALAQLCSPTLPKATPEITMSTRPILGTNMSNDNSLSLPELDDRIALIRDNIRQLVEQAAASLGAEDEELISGRIAQQQEKLDKLVKDRDAMLTK
jgi:hypothetical protein